MSSIPQVGEAMKRVLTTRAKELERESGLVQRSTAQLDGPIFAQMTVFGWMDNPEASYAQLRHVAASLDVSVSTQAVEQRFGAQSAAFLNQISARIQVSFMKQWHCRAGSPPASLQPIPTSS